MIRPLGLEVDYVDCGEVTYGLSSNIYVMLTRIGEAHIDEQSRRREFSRVNECDRFGEAIALLPAEGDAVLDFVHRHVTGLKIVIFHASVDRSTFVRFQVLQTRILHIIF